MRTAAVSHIPLGYGGGLYFRMISGNSALKGLSLFSNLSACFPNYLLVYPLVFLINYQGLSVVQHGLILKLQTLPCLEETLQNNIY